MPESFPFIKNMQTDSKDGHASLAEVLRSALQLPEGANQNIGTLSREVGEKGFGLLLMILSLPSALPIPAPGYSTPFGIVIALIALQLLVGRRRIWLPKRLEAIRIRPKLADRMLGTAAGFLRRIERRIRPRQCWIRSRAGQAGLSIVIVMMASLMILPIPLTNTFPAMVIFILGIGLSEEDGLLALGAFAAGCFAILLYAGVIYLSLTQGPEAIESIKDWLKSILGLFQTSAASPDITNFGLPQRTGEFSSIL